MKVEKAKIKDAAQIHKAINYFADKDEMLPRALSEIYENIRDYFVVRQDGQVIGSVALHICWSDLAEVKSLAVDEASQRQGIGSQLVKTCLKEAKELGISTIFCLTYRPGFFARLGFSEVDKMTLPRKVWIECYRCPKFPDCGEVAMVYNSGTPSEA